MRVELQGIPETTLWTLYMRAVEARRPDGVIDDRKAVELLERIDYPFEERFGASCCRSCCT
jgi:O-methyltransferase involved in polyketide biosynthesis